MSGAPPSPATLPFGAMRLDTVWQYGVVRCADWRLGRVGLLGVSRRALRLSAQYAEPSQRRRHMCDSGWHPRCCPMTCGWVVWTAAGCAAPALKPRPLRAIERERGGAPLRATRGSGA